MVLGLVQTRGPDPDRSSWAWIVGHGTGSNRQLLADVDGILGADALVYFGNGGLWYGAHSTGASFTSFVPHVFGMGEGSTEQFVGDLNNDNRDDLVTFTPATPTMYSQWNAALSY